MIRINNDRMAAHTLHADECFSTMTNGSACAHGAYNFIIPVVRSIYLHNDNLEKVAFDMQSCALSALFINVML